MNTFSINTPKTKQPARFPRSPSEARQRSRRKIEAARKRARNLLLEVAVFWDEGMVTGQIDLALEEIDRQLDEVLAQMDEEVEAEAER